MAGCLESRSTGASMTLGLSRGLGPEELAWCWGGLKAWVCGSQPGTGPSQESGFVGAYLEPVFVGTIGELGATGTI